MTSVHSPWDVVQSATVYRAKDERGLERKKTFFECTTVEKVALVSMGVLMVTGISIYNFACGYAFYYGGAWALNALAGTTFVLRNAALFGGTWEVVSGIASLLLNSANLNVNYMWMGRWIVSASITLEVMKYAGLALTAPAWLSTATVVAAVGMGVIGAMTLYSRYGQPDPYQGVEKGLDGLLASEERSSRRITYGDEKFTVTHNPRDEEVSEEGCQVSEKVIIVTSKLLSQTMHNLLVEKAGGEGNLVEIVKAS
ncbi:MAG: hypothetical protein P0S94_00195 [Simkaniaceae bacterium]|nr:hypothetical protein [Simkaniaceae bacterium]